MNSDIEFQFQSADLQAFSCLSKELGHYTFQLDIVFASLQTLGRVHIFCTHADAGLAVSRNDLILLLAYEQELEGDSGELSACGGAYGARPTLVD